MNILKKIKKNVTYPIRFLILRNRILKDCQKYTKESGKRIFWSIKIKWNHDGYDIYTGKMIKKFPYILITAKYFSGYSLYFRNYKYYKKDKRSLVL